MTDFVWFDRRPRGQVLRDLLASARQVFAACSRASYRRHYEAEDDTCDDTSLRARATISFFKSASSLVVAVPAVSHDGNWCCLDVALVEREAMGLATRLVRLVRENERERAT